MVAQFPGPAFIISDEGGLDSVNREAEQVTQILSDRDNEMAKSLLDMVSKTIQSQAPIKHNISITKADDPGAGAHVFELTLLPLNEEGTRQCLCLANEITLERNLTKALVASRELYRDLVTCSSDFAWETDSKGVFIYVSNRGAVGYSPAALNGRSALTLMQQTDAIGDLQAFPFSTSVRVEEIEVVLSGADGRDHRMLISAIPVMDQNGEWCGTRGVGHDITTLREREAELSQSRARDRLAAKVADAMLADLDPDEMLITAAKAIVSTLDAWFGWVIKTGELEADFVSNVAGYHARDRVSAAGRADLAVEIIDSLTANERQSVRPFVREFEGNRYLICATNFASETNGILCIARHLEEEPWHEHHFDLLRLVAGHVGIAIAQANQVEELKIRSRTDGMTGLLNRTAFIEEVGGCMRRNERSGRASAMLYFDLDDFKKINDTWGHSAGDQAIMVLSDHLLNKSRRGDVGVRFGGDEFGLWLDGCGGEGAEAKAKSIIKGVEAAVEQLAVPWTLTCSIGIAVADPFVEEDIEAFITRADTGLYRAKKLGKNAWCLGDPVDAEDACEPAGEDER